METNEEGMKEGRCLPYHFQACLQSRAIQPSGQVVTDVQVGEVKALLHVVVVAEFFNLVVAEAQPDDRLGNESVVEPLQLVVRHVQPLEMVLGRQEAIDVLESIVVQPQGLDGARQKKVSRR